ncbi:hypothetical protein SBA5_80069 [Candidatus Sulfotelmatomonas gaucii]|uniref:Uncharacterized protein n=1 Tax=Candidatus Sulfuritelmatomonas gaucii TaxID=2043161 RepID=A0A2N9M5N1_9BACT|nr:hypothetical protein SBA5_80069 [Candidatus Sulfotelmatomonas gaucii]
MTHKHFTSRNFFRRSRRPFAFSSGDPNGAAILSRKGAPNPVAPAGITAPAAQR